MGPIRNELMSASGVWDGPPSASFAGWLLKIDLQVWWLTQPYSNFIFNSTNFNSHSNSSSGIGIKLQFQFWNWIDPKHGVWDCGHEKAPQQSLYHTGKKLTYEGLQ